MSSTNIRWHQRLENFQMVLVQLTEAYHLAQSRPLSDLEKQGAIQAFEYTHELAWNVIKDYFKDQGNSSIMGSKDAAREAFQKGLILNGHLWMEMVESRNQTSHTYNKVQANQILEKIWGHYWTEFNTFNDKMNSLKS